MKKKKGTKLYTKIVASFAFFGLMLILLLFTGYSTATKIITVDDPESYLRGYSIFTAVIFFWLVASGTFLSATLPRSLRMGVNEVRNITNRLASGDVEIEVDNCRKDEFGDLLDNYEKLILASREQAELAEAVAEGNMTIDITPRSDKDKLGFALKKMVERNNLALSSIRDSAVQVTTSSSEVASASESLAQGATEQASAIEQITASISDVAEKTKENAKLANDAAGLVDVATENVKKGNAHMQEMMEAMNEINASSESISKIIKVIDDIAFQTNILALNAAVEAARAGEAGKGFAVVAEEVRNLAAKSAQAAAETAELIEDSIHKVESGSTIADGTAKALDEITSAVSESGVIIRDIAESSNYQATAIAQINQAVEQVSQVVQKNSSTSEACAAACVELFNQALLMKDELAIYRLDGANRAMENEYEETTGNAHSVDRTVAGEQMISLGEGFGKY